MGNPTDSDQQENTTLTSHNGNYLHLDDTTTQKE